MSPMAPLVLHSGLPTSHRTDIVNGLEEPPGLHEDPCCCWVLWCLRGYRCLSGRLPLTSFGEKVHHSMLEHAVLLHILKLIYKKTAITISWRLQILNMVHRQVTLQSQEVDLEKAKLDMYHYKHSLLSGSSRPAIRSRSRILKCERSCFFLKIVIPCSYIFSPRKHWQPGTSLCGSSPLLSPLLLSCPTRQTSKFDI